MVRPRTVNLRDPKNILCCRLAMLGFSQHVIQKRTGLTPSRVAYRLRKTDIRIRDYREARTPIADVVIAKTEEATLREIEHRLRPLLRGR